MKIDVRRPRDLGEPELSAWRSMRRASPTSPARGSAPEFAQAVSTVRDDARVAVIWEDTEIAGFLPFEPCGPRAGRPAGRVDHFGAGRRAPPGLS